jgi:hypothetical protein
MGNVMLCKKVIDEADHFLQTTESGLLVARAEGFSPAILYIDISQYNG